MSRRTDLSMRLNHARCALGLTMLDAADQIGVTRKTVASWESGAAVPNPAMLLPIALVYRIERDDLVPLRDRAARSRRRRQLANGQNEVAA